jgi:putative sterol carrier protein
MASIQRQQRRRRRPGQAITDRFARYVARSSPERRARAMRGWRRPIITRRIFKAMEHEFDPKKGEGVDAAIHWEIGGRGDGGVDRWQVVIGDGRCRATRKLDREPTVIIKLDGPQFLELVTGIASGPELFMSGKLKVEGDLMLAARLASLFRIPQPATDHPTPSS